MNLNIWQALFFGLLQGVTEPFPVSSLGHTVILPGLLGWGYLQGGTSCAGQSCFLPFNTALHLGTSVALVIYFWRDWLRVILTLFNSIKKGEVRTGTDDWVSWLIIIGIVPAALIGVALESFLKQLFGSPVIASAFLVVNGSILFAGERMRRRAEDKISFATAKEREASFRPLSSLTWREALLVGVAQSLALIPGISRSGVTMVAGLGVRLNHEDAARYSFLMSTPLIGLAALLEVPQLIGLSATIWLYIVLGMIVAGITSYLSAKFLMKYFETGRLDPFAYYCWGAGLVSLVLLLTVLHAGA
jgi:undecaprenyl-diphosphatase